MIPTQMIMVRDHEGNPVWVEPWKIYRVARGAGFLDNEEFALVGEALAKLRVHRVLEIKVAMMEHPDPHPTLGVPPAVKTAIQNLGEVEEFMKLIGVVLATPDELNRQVAQVYYDGLEER